MDSGFSRVSESVQGIHTVLFAALTQQTGVKSLSMDAEVQTWKMRAAEQAVVKYLQGLTGRGGDGDGDASMAASMTASIATPAPASMAASMTASVTTPAEKSMATSMTASVTTPAEKSMATSMTAPAPALASMTASMAPASMEEESMATSVAVAAPAPAEESMAVQAVQAVQGMARARVVSVVSVVSLTLAERLGLTARTENCPTLVEKPSPSSLGKTATELSGAPEGPVSIFGQCGRKGKGGDYCENHKEEGKRLLGLVTDTKLTEAMEVRMHSLAKKMTNEGSVKVLGERLGLELERKSLKRKRAAPAAAPAAVKPLFDDAAEEEEEEPAAKKPKMAAAAAATKPKMAEAEAEEEDEEEDEDEEPAAKKAATKPKKAAANDSFSLFLPAATKELERQDRRAELVVVRPESSALDEEEEEDEETDAFINLPNKHYGEVEVEGKIYYYNRDLKKKKKECTLFLKEGNVRAMNTFKKVMVGEYKVLNWD
jgi:hypothetical protein